MEPDELSDALRALRRQTDEDVRRRFDRSLPFSDMLFDRWERADRLGFGEGASVYDSALIFGDVRVGEQTWVGPYTVLDGSGGGLTIGSYCSISAGVQIYTHDTVLWALSGGQAKPRRAPVAIGDQCYLGSMAIVEAGVEVGDEAVVAANSFVNTPVASRTIVAGSPARPIGRVEDTDDGITLVYDPGSPKPGAHA